jgi:lipopolysaccharide biosynthesis glycosyltransferase
MNINNQEICFVFAIDDKYFEQFRVFIFSLHTHNNWISGNNIFVLFSSSTLSLNNREKLKLECRERYLLELEWISCDDYISNNLKISSSDHVSVSTYFRLFLHELIPNNFSYAL